MKLEDLFDKTYMFIKHGDFIAVRVPKEAYDFDLTIPYSNRITFFTDKSLNVEIGKKTFIFNKIESIECPMILPGSSIRYEIVGKLPDIKNLEPLEYIIKNINKDEFNQWLIIKVNEKKVA